MIISILKLAKPITGLVAFSGTSTVVHNVINYTTPDDLNRYSKFMVKAGGFFVSSAISAAISDRVEGKFDTLIKRLEAKPEVETAAEHAVKVLADLTLEEQLKVLDEMATEITKIQEKDAV